LSDCLNGILAGLVAITGPCPVVTAYGAVFIGASGGIVFKLFSWLMLKLRIDDPLDAFAVHGGCGMWGLLMGGFFATEEFVKQTYGDQHPDWGVFYGGNGTQLGAQIIGILVTPLRPMFWGVVIFGAFRLIDMKRFDNPLFMFMDYSTFETLNFGRKTEVESASYFKDPLVTEMNELPMKRNSTQSEKSEGNTPKEVPSVSKRKPKRKDSSDSGTASASSDDDDRPTSSIHIHDRDSPL